MVIYWGYKFFLEKKEAGTSAKIIWKADVNHLGHHNLMSLRMPIETMDTLFRK